MGLNINDIDTSTTKTLGALQLEVAASTELMTYVQKENSPEYENLLEGMVEFFKRRKKDDSDIELSLNVKVRNQNTDEEKELSGIPEVDETGQPVTRGDSFKVARPFNLEDFKDLARKYPWRIEISGGVVNNPVLEDQLSRDIIGLSDPTSRARANEMVLRANRFGRNYRAEDFAPAGAEPAAPAATPATIPNI